MEQIECVTNPDDIDDVNLTHGAVAEILQRVFHAERDALSSFLRRRHQETLRSFDLQRAARERPASPTPPQEESNNLSFSPSNSPSGKKPRESSQKQFLRSKSGGEDSNWSVSESSLSKESKKMSPTRLDQIHSFFNPPPSEMMKGSSNITANSSALSRHGSKDIASYEYEEEWYQRTSKNSKEHSIRSIGDVEQSSWLRRASKSEWFEGLFGILIISNALVMCVESQYHGLDSGHELGYPGMSKPASESWPHAEAVFRVLDIIFGLAFVVEVVVKLVGLQREFFSSCWNWFDSIIIAMWLTNIMFADMLPVDPLTLRIARLARLIRIFRLVRTIQIFDILHLMVASLSASMAALLWSVVLLFGIMMSTALVMINMIEFYLADDDNPQDKQMLAFKYFGTFSKAFLSVFEVTLGNFAPVIRFLHDDISEVYSACFMIYYCLVSFAILMVIRGIFLHETFQAADSNDNLMILRQHRTKAKILRKLQNLFYESDVSDDGTLSYQKFTLLLREPRVQTWLAAMGLEVRDADAIFDMVDSGEKRVNMNGFVSGFLRLKGQARAIDLVQVLRMSRTILELVMDVKDQIFSAHIHPQGMGMSTTSPLNLCPRIREAGGDGENSEASSCIGAEFPLFPSPVTPTPKTQARGGIIQEDERWGQSGLQ